MEYNGMAMGNCTQCNKTVPIEDLSFLPDTDEFYRTVLTKKHTDGGIQVPKNVDSSVMLCPDCMAKWEREHRKSP